MLNSGIHLYRKPSIFLASIILFQFCKKEAGEVVDFTRLLFIEILHSLLTHTVGLIDKKIRLFQQSILQLCIELLGYMRSQYINYLGYLVVF